MMTTMVAMVDRRGIFRGKEGEGAYEGRGLETEEEGESEVTNMTT